MLALVSSAHALENLIRPPNVILIVADDLAAESIGAYRRLPAAAASHTPWIDALATDGARFLTCWATPACAVSRAQLLTGRYGFRTGWTDQRAGHRPNSLSRDEISIARLMQSAGYRTGLFGKWHLAPLHHEPDHLAAHGFDEWLVWEGAGADRFWCPEMIDSRGILNLDENDFGPDRVNDALLSFVTSPDERPFFAYYPMLLVHRPHPETPSLDVPDTREPPSLAGSLRYMDHLVGRLLVTLDGHGLADQTWVIFTSDNAPQSKFIVAEASVQVPLIIAGPLAAPGVRSELIDFSDFLPTLADLAGVSIPDDRVIDGRSFAWVLRGEQGVARDWIYAGFREQHVLRDRRNLIDRDGIVMRCDPRSGRALITAETRDEIIEARRRFAEIHAALTDGVTPADGPVQGVVTVDSADLDQE